MEIETKIIGLNIKSFREKLRYLEAEKTYSGTNTTIFFDNGLLKKNCALRLRDFNSKRAELTYKGPKISSNYKVREEINILVDNFRICRALLNKLGFKEKDILKNKRESYELDLDNKKYHIDIDYYGGLEPFVEIESATEEDLGHALKYFDINKDMIFNGSVYDLRKSFKQQHKDL